MAEAAETIDPTVEHEQSPGVFRVLKLARDYHQRRGDLILEEIFWEGPAENLAHVYPAELPNDSRSDFLRQTSFEHGVRKKFAFEQQLPDGTWSRCPDPRQQTDAFRAQVVEDTLNPENQAWYHFVNLETLEIQEPYATAMADERTSPPEREAMAERISGFIRQQALKRIEDTIKSLKVSEVGIQRILDFADTVESSST